MPEKVEARKKIKDSEMANFLHFLEKWSISTGKDRTTALETDIWNHCPNPSIIKEMIRKISDLEHDREELQKAEEHIRRLEKGCYGRCIHYERRTNSNPGEPEKN